MLETIATYNPDASLATWNFLRMVNPEHTLDVRLLPDREEVDVEGQSRLALRIDDMFGDYGRDYGGGLSTLIDVLTFALLTQGAIAGELEVSGDLKDVLDWCPVSPRRITFLEDDVTGHYKPTCIQYGQTIYLSEVQFRYIPLDAKVDGPYGRAPFLPVLETVVFQTEVLRDLKVVAHTQGHPRLHFKVLEAIAEEHVPQYLREPGHEDDLRVWMDAWLSDIASQYKMLQPDDALFTWDWVDVAGVSAGAGSFNIDALTKVVEKQVISSLKQLPIMLGRMEGSGLAHGTVQWQVFSQTIFALRQKISAMIGWWATQTLRVWGHPSVATLTFPTLRTQDRVKEAQAERLEIGSSILKYMMGWVTNDELAQKHVGHDAISDPIAIPNVSVGSGAGEGKGEGAEGEGSAAEGRQYGLPAQVESFKSLPVWMQSRIRALEQSVSAQALVKRDEVFAELMSDNGG